MVTKCSCTVIREVNSTMQIMFQGECMWQETEAYQTKKYGADNADKVTIYIPNITADIKKQDFICKGEIEVSGISESLLTAYRVNSVTNYDYGLTLQHLRIGAI